MITKKEIIFPFLLNCCEHSNDSYWKNVFENLSYGKAPSGTYIHKNFLCCGYKNKDFSYKLENKDPKQLHDDIYFLLKEKLGILSYTEKENKMCLFRNAESKIQTHSHEWSHIRKKNNKDLLLEQYVLELANTHSMSTEQSKKLLSIINISMMLKTITSSDIVYKNDKIIHITGIDFDTDKMTVVKTTTNISHYTSNETELLKMSDNWEVFLNKLKKGI